MRKQILISDPVQLVTAIHFARENGCEKELAVKFLHLLEICASGMWQKTVDGVIEPSAGEQKAEIGYDFAPYSFSFVMLHDGKRDMNGGFIYAGPGAPGDGSFPSLSVNLSYVTGNAPTHSWSIHT